MLNVSLEVRGRSSPHPRKSPSASVGSDLCQCNPSPSSSVDIEYGRGPLCLLHLCLGPHPPSSTSSYTPSCPILPCPFTPAVCLLVLVGTGLQLALIERSAQVFLPAGQASKLVQHALQYSVHVCSADRASIEMGCKIVCPRMIHNHFIHFALWTVLWTIVVVKILNSNNWLTKLLITFWMQEAFVTSRRSFEIWSCWHARFGN